MSFKLEFKKIKRTGFLISFIAGGIIAATIPILNMLVRSELYAGINNTPISILLDANWQMMAMINVLLLIVGACIMYHTEHSENAMQKMRTLPIKESKIFLGKFTLMLSTCLIILFIEAVSICFCTFHWFGFSTEWIPELLKNFIYIFLLMLPAALFSLVIASICKNMWISLGISTVCIFTATMILPTKNFLLSLFPFALPFKTLSGATIDTVRNYIIAMGVEIVAVCIIEAVFLKVRRTFE